MTDAAPLDRSAIERLVLDALTNANLARPSTSQLEVSPDATIFGADSSLDSLGLVALLIDVEEALHDRGVAVTLTDARAMSQTSSPFRGVQPLVDYIGQLVSATAR